MIVKSLKWLIFFFFNFKTKSLLQIQKFPTNLVLFIFQLVLHMWERRADTPLTSCDFGSLSWKIKVLIPQKGKHF